MTGDQSAQVKQILEHARQLRIDFESAIGAGWDETMLRCSMDLLEKIIARAIFAIKHG